MRDFKKLLEFYNCLGPGAEIGVAEGRSSYDFLSMGVPTLFMVDNWGTLDQKGDGGFEQSWHDENYRQAKERVKEFGDKAIFLRGKSVDMAEKIYDCSLDWCYIDADHSYEGTKNDLWAWALKVKLGGIIAGHDYDNEAYGVTQAVQEFCAKFEYQPIHTIQETENNCSFWFIRTH